jgi:hypothetical protein
MPAKIAYLFDRAISNGPGLTLTSFTANCTGAVGAPGGTAARLALRNNGERSLYSVIARSISCASGKKSRKATDHKTTTDMKELPIALKVEAAENPPNIVMT